MVPARKCALVLGTQVSTWLFGEHLANCCGDREDPFLFQEEEPLKCLGLGGRAEGGFFPLKS